MVGPVGRMMVSRMTGFPELTLDVLPACPYGGLPRSGLYGRGYYRHLWTPVTGWVWLLEGLEEVYEWLG